MDTPKESGIDRAITLAGGQMALAAAIGCSQQNVSFWKTQGFVPLMRAIEVEQATGVPRAQLIDPRIWNVINTDVI